MIMYDNKDRRLSIIQDTDELMELYAGNMTYDTGDYLFMRYFRGRVGTQIPKGSGPTKDEFPDEHWLEILQWRLQDCWKLFEQPGVRQEYALECMINDAKRR